jgi:hypothetical protein
MDTYFVEKLFERIDNVINKLEEINTKLNETLLVNQAVLQENQTMSVQLDNLIAQVAETKTVEESAILLIQGLADRLVEAVAELNANLVDTQKLQELADELNQSSDALAEAITANTQG